MRQTRVLARRLAAGLAHFGAEKSGVTAITVALLAVPLVFAAGMAIDYSDAERRQDQLNGFADSAVLAALTPAMMSQSDATSQATATSMFNAQVKSLSDAKLTANIQVTATDTNTAVGITRTVTLTYSATSANFFGGILGLSTTPIQGASTATQSQAPNINYYMLLDTSPSMAIAATQAGINTMVANTSHQGGCAFGCHELDPQADNLGNPNGEDNYTLARNLGVSLRIDLVNSATQSMLSSATTAGSTNHATYNFDLYAFNYYFTELTSGMSSASTAQSAATGIQQLEVYNNSGYLTKTLYNDDEDTNWDLAMGSLAPGGAKAMPKPGNGTNNPGDTPQEVLFIVSDGVIDESSGGRLISPVDEFSTWCSKVKANGVRIAFLYTTYYPLPTNAFYNSYVAPYQSQIGPTYAQNCASPGLYFEVSTGGDITSAMTTLFQKTVTTAHLTQ